MFPPFLYGTDPSNFVSFFFLFQDYLLEFVGVFLSAFLNLLLLSSLSHLFFIVGSTFVDLLWLLFFNFSVAICSFGLLSSQKYVLMLSLILEIMYVSSPIGFTSGPFFAVLTSWLFPLFI